MFIDRFKYYKAKKPSPNYENVIDILNSTHQSVRKKYIFCEKDDCSKLNFGLKSTQDWNIYEFNDIPGLILIQNPFDAAGQQQWILKCLREYTEKPNKLNIDVHGFLNNDKSWWENCFGSEENKKLLSKLRWATLGYHHNWDTKHYSEDSKTEIPKDLKNLTNCFAKILGFHDFTAEAAIVNFYRMNSTLAGHIDHSEAFLEAPLFSISFGQSAIFLIGGFEREDDAHALFLHSGDVLVMSGSSRLRYHGVPKILKSDLKPWDSIDYSSVMDEDWKKVQLYISEARINLNVRQVLKPGQTCL